MSKAGAHLFSKALFPTETHFKQAMTYMDLGVKVELMLMEMYSNLFWNSVLELLIFVVMLILFITDPAALGGIWLMIIHVIRGAIGLLILRNMPLTHDIIKNASAPMDEQMDFDQMF